MRVEIRSRGMDIGERLRDYSIRRVRFALGRYGTRIVRAVVFLTDLNGPRGGIDKQCRILLRLRPGREVTVEASDADLLAAVDRAADRARHALSRDIQRRQHRNRRLPRGRAAHTTFGVPWGNPLSEENRHEVPGL